MKPPIIVVENGDVAIFESAVKAELGLEPVDVKNGEFVAYDSDGQQLCLVVVQMRKSSIGKAKSVDAVKINGVEQGDHASDLRQALINFFKNTYAYEQEDESLQLKELVNKAVKKYGYVE